MAESKYAFVDDLGCCILCQCVGVPGECCNQKWNSVNNDLIMHVK